MSDVVIAGDTSGSITLRSPAVSGSSVLTLPVATDTLVGKATTDTLTNKTLTAPTITGANITVASGAAPAFSAYASTYQTLTALTVTKATFDTEVFDTNSNFASSRFTPTVAGYYQINTIIYFGGSPTGATEIRIYKNGVFYAQPFYSTATSAAIMQAGSELISFNGSTDYVEIYVASQSGATLGGNAGSQYVRFSGAMVRSA